MSDWSLAVKKPKDLILGVLFLAISLLVVSVASGYELGTSRQLGPGYLPMILGACLAVIALVLIFGSFHGEAVATESFAVRPAVFVLGAALMFGVLIRPLGLPLTVFLLVFPAALADGRRRLMPLLTLALVLSVGTTLLFPLALGQQIPILGTLFGY